MFFLLFLGIVWWLECKYPIVWFLFILWDECGFIVIAFCLSFLLGFARRWPHCVSIPLWKCLRMVICSYWHGFSHLVSRLTVDPWSEALTENILACSLCALFLFSIFPCFGYLFTECIIILISVHGSKELQRIHI